jgi:CheY-like chemotaxis protein
MALASARVLIVDDEESYCRFVEQVFREGGSQTLTAGDGAEALRLVEQQPAFDLFVLDVMMPQMHGYELARQLRERQPDAKILYLTGFPDRLFEERNKLLWDNEAFIEKPVSPNGLLEAASLLLFGQVEWRVDATAG